MELKAQETPIALAPCSLYLPQSSAIPPHPKEFTPAILEAFEPLPDDQVNFGIGDGGYWFRFRLKNSSDSYGHFALELVNPRLDFAELFAPEPDGGWQVERAGKGIPFEVREIAYRNPAFRVNLPPNSEREYFLRVQHHGSYRFLMRLWSEQGFEAHRAASERAVGLLYGALLVMALHNLYAAIMLREKAFAVHFLLLVSYLLYSMSLQGTAFQLLWPNATWWAVRSTIALQGIVIVCVFWFARLFLRTPDHAPRLDRVMQAFMVFGAVLSAANLAQYIWVNTMAHWGAAISVITIAAAAFYVYLQGFRPALTFLLAWFVSLAGAVSISLVGLKVLPQSFITENGMHIGIALAFLLFSFALTQRVRQAEADYRDRLESVVAERTQELKAALANVKTLKGLIPICCNCKKVRDDQGYWNQIEMYIADNSEADLTHGICPDCFEKLYGQDLQALRERAAKRSKGRDSDLRGAAEDLDEM